MSSVTLQPLLVEHEVYLDGRLIGVLKHGRASCLFVPVSGVARLFPSYRAARAALDRLEGCYKKCYPDPAEA
jgi:hypothetical protein